MALAEERGQHAAQARAELLNGVGVVLAYDADDGGEVDGADGLGKTVAGFDELFVAHRRTFVGQAFAEAEKAALGCSCCLVAQFAIANLRRVHAPRKLPRHAISIESLKGK